MPSHAAYIREAILRGGPEIGRVFPITALAATTVTSTALIGGLPSQAYERDYLMRRDSASLPADRERIVQSFAGSTGVLTIQGANYADTTVGSEVGELIKVPPYILDTALQVAIGKLRHEERTEFPTYYGSRYELDELTWVTGPGDLVSYRVTTRPSRQVTRARYFNQWNVVNPETASTTALPDWWALTGSSATSQRVTNTTTATFKSKYAVALTRSGTDCALRQSFCAPLGSTRSLWDDGTGQSYAGETMSAFARVTASVASRVRISLYDGVTHSYSSYHTGGGTIEELTVEKTFASTATQGTLYLWVETGNTTAYWHEAAAFHGSGLDDAERRDDFNEGTVGARYQQTGTPTIILPPKGFGSQYIVYTRRPYTQFTESKILAGTSDTDVVDAPLIPVAAGILAQAYEFLASRSNDTERTRYDKMAAMWGRRFTKLAAAHMHSDNPEGGGLSIWNPGFVGRPQRF